MSLNLQYQIWKYDHAQSEGNSSFKKVKEVENEGQDAIL